MTGFTLHRVPAVVAPMEWRRGMLGYMRRATVEIPDELHARLRHEAELRGTTISDISRQALEAYLGGASTRRRLGAAGAGHSDRSDISERIKEVLAAEVTAPPRPGSEADLHP